ncbi:hypothetical protein [Nocardioides sp.]|uniref:hypothetical protein n=1 Tax=Nocardioides sp. TaxID=35761 RepID=UPI002735E070|nr:hypothetical protein [Nocardioides sp.]MDP3893464.1 hypothetical protein [Nocardioides sp.]
MLRRTKAAAEDEESPRATRVVSVVGSAAAVFLVVGVLFALSPVGEGALEPATAGGGARGIATTGDGGSWPETLASGLERRPIGDHVRVIAVHPQGWTTLTTTLVAAQENRAAQLCEAVREIEEQLGRGTGRRVFVADRRGSAMLAC